MAFRFGPQDSYIQIGTQKWQRRNLDVSTYRNGDPIPYVADEITWANLTTGAWCWFNNDPELGKIYGKLYNWYAATDPRGLAPVGWHVPTNAEWTTLTTFVGNNGGALKQTGTTLWNSPNTGATNSTRFTALPGGFRQDSGPFSLLSINTNGNWWTTTETSTIEAYVIAILHNTTFIIRAPDGKTSGLSVRCIKD
jgi:uncharacterized protein (TIGR02145 family)